MGANLISFYPASRGSNVKAIGPILPVIPAPGSGKDILCGTRKVIEFLKLDWFERGHSTARVLMK